MTKCLLIYHPSCDDEERDIYQLEAVCLSQEEVDSFLSKRARYKPYEKTAFKIVEYETGLSIDLHESFSDEEDHFNPKCPTCEMTNESLGYVIAVDKDMWMCKNGHKWPMEWFVEYKYLDGKKKRVPFILSREDNNE
jgi:hypothetical protein